MNTGLGPTLGIKPNPQAAAGAEELLLSSLSKIESVWLKGNGKFLLGSSQPSIADLSLVCEIMQLKVKDWLSTCLLVFCFFFVFSLMCCLFGCLGNGLSFEKIDFLSQFHHSDGIGNLLMIKAIVITVDKY